MEITSEKYKQLTDELESRLECVRYYEQSALDKSDLVRRLTDNKKGEFNGKLSGSEYYESDFVENLKANKKAIMDFCIEHPEMSYNVLYWPVVLGLVTKRDFTGYTKEQITKIPRLIREVVVHPDNVYKLKVKHKIDERIFYYIPNTNYWEALEWIATYAPDKLKSVITKKSELNPYGRKNVSDHYKKVEDKNTIPEALREFLYGSEKLHEGQVENGKKTSEMQRANVLARKRSWVDSEGKLLELFRLSDGMKITSVDDYKLIASYFRESDLSVSDFCRKFRIDDIKGFKKMCEKIALSDADFAEFYKNNLETKSNAYVAIIKHQIEGIADENFTIEEMLTSQSQMKSLETVMEIGQSTVTRERICRFSEKVIDYYHSRINSYDANSNEPSDIDKRLTEDEVKFLMSSRVLAKKRYGKNIDLGEEFAKPFIPVVKQISPASKNRIYNGYDGLKRKLNAYSDDYRSDKYLSGEVQFVLSDGQTSKITQEMVDMAEAYASKHGLYKAGGTMSRIVKAVAEGKIQNQAETAEYKQKLHAQILKRMKECKNLSEYFEKYRSL